MLSGFTLIRNAIKHFEKIRLHHTTRGMPLGRVFLALTVLFVPMLIDAAELKCGDNASWQPGRLVLSGQKIIDLKQFSGVDPRFAPPPITYKERMELQKAENPNTMDGKWKIVRFIQEQSGVNGLNGISGSTKVPISPGQELQCAYKATGSTLVTNCSGGNIFLDFYKGRIGSIKTNTWIGKYDKEDAHVQFGQPPYLTNPLLTSKSFAPAYNANLIVEMVNASDGKNGRKHVFSKGEVARFEITYRARVEPDSLSCNVEWNTPDIGSSEKQVFSGNGKCGEATISWQGLPNTYSAFGEKTVTATLNVDGCGTVSESKTFEIFFPAEEHNNPGKELPNWFYYWNQTSARDASNLPVFYGGDSIGECVSFAASAFYSPRLSAMYMCNLAAPKRGKFHIQVQALKRKAPYIRVREVSYINAFASVLAHENVHYQAHKWRKQQGTDSDGDGLTDQIEIAKGLNRYKKLTFYPEMFEWWMSNAKNKPKTKAYLEKLKGALGDSDEEWLAYETQGSFKGDYRKYDWAFPGSQWQLGVAHP